jgi:two-component system sensor histidine kinase ChvG
MASDIDSTSNDEPGLTLSWSRRWSLGYRILAVNVLTLLLLAMSVLYLDVFRNRLSKERVRQTRIEATAPTREPSAGSAPRLGQRWWC